MIMVAKVFDAHDRDGRAVFGPDRERLADPAERRALVRYLRAGRLVIATPGKDRDRLVPELGRVVPLGFRTDGVWVWSEAIAYYVEKHGIAPDPVLRAHAAAQGYQVPEVPDELVRAASQAVLT
jgi:hypothetical protein